MITRRNRWPLPVFNDWHRTLGDEFTCIDGDLIETKEGIPVAIIELKRANEKDRVCTVTKRLAMMAGIAAYLVVYDCDTHDRCGTCGAPNDDPGKDMHVRVVGIIDLMSGAKAQEITVEAFKEILRNMRKRIGAAFAVISQELLRKPICDLTEDEMAIVCKTYRVRHGKCSVAEVQ